MLPRNPKLMHGSTLSARGHSCAAAALGHSDRRCRDFRTLTYFPFTWDQGLAFGVLWSGGLRNLRRGRKNGSGCPFIWFLWVCSHLQPSSAFRSFVGLLSAPWMGAPPLHTAPKCLMLSALSFRYSDPSLNLLRGF